MSLSAWNTPPLVSTAMGVLALALPLYENAIIDGTISWTGVKTINALSYAINLVSVSIPGRLDGQQQQKQEQSQEKIKGDALKDDTDDTSNNKMDELTVSLVAPSGWAFAIWGPIFAGELVFSISQLLIPESAAIATTIKKLSGPFVAGQLFQSLWCAAFRPKYEKGSLMLISSAGLAGAAYSLSKVHAAYAIKTKFYYSSLQYCIYFLPTSLHFGWLTAATLVNLNGAVARMTSCPKTIAAVGHASVIAATVTGVVVTLSRGAPVYGGVIAWALLAVADGMKKRLEKAKKNDIKSTSKGVHGALAQQRLSTLGAVISITSSIISAYSLFTSSNK